MNKLNTIAINPNLNQNGNFPRHKIPLRHGRPRVAAHAFAPILTFQDAEHWADRVMGCYLSQRTAQRFPGQASYTMLECVFRFTQQMVVENKIDRIHTSCINRMPKVHHQERSPFAVVLLLLSLRYPSLMDRRRRYRFARALSLAQKHRIPPKQLIGYLRTAKGYSRVV